MFDNKPDTVKVEVELPSTITVHIPSFADVPLERVMKAIYTQGYDQLERTIVNRVLERFVAEHEEYIQQTVEDLLEENRDEIKKILSK